MDESVLSYLGIENERLSDTWSYIFELAKARNIAATRSRENQISWGSLSILEGEEHHHEEI